MNQIVFTGPAIIGVIQEPVLRLAATANTNGNAVITLKVTDARTDLPGRAGHGGSPHMQ